MNRVKRLRIKPTPALPCRSSLAFSSSSMSMTSTFLDLRDLAGAETRLFVNILYISYPISSTPPFLYHSAVKPTIRLLLVYHYYWAAIFSQTTLGSIVKPIFIKISLHFLNFRFRFVILMTHTDTHADTHTHTLTHSHKHTDTLSLSLSKHPTRTVLFVFIITKHTPTHTLRVESGRRGQKSRKK